MARLSLALAMMLLPTTAAAEEPVKQKWQYCVLERVSPAGNGAPATMDDVTLQLPDAQIKQAVSFEGLASQLSIRLANPKETPTLILNYLGGEGWELVSHTERVYVLINQRFLCQTWTFKRPR